VVFVLIIVAYILFNASLEKIKEVKATNNANTIKYYEVGVLDFSRHDNWDDVAQYVDQNLTLTAVSHNKQHILYKSFSSNGRIIEIRMNDFPDEPLYTLLEHGIEIIHFNNLPKNWIIQK
ncbi:MAG TPA: hypothetical protein PKW30_01550, partial [Campylobacterales bacterium]|nr:hypothetical protein [Campylobacterales bacterium]